MRVRVHMRAAAVPFRLCHSHGCQLVIDMRLHTDIRPAGETRDFKLTMDYERAANIASEIAGNEHEKLIETVAERIASALHAEFTDRLERVWVRVAKPSALAGETVVAVEITR